MLDGVRAVLYREVQVMRTRIRRSILASMVSPALFLVAFGYGLGRGQSFSGVEYLDFLFPGLLAMSTVNACYGIGTDINIARFYFRVFDEYLIAPVPRWHLPVGEMLYGMLKGMIPVVIFFVYAGLAGLGIQITPLFCVVLFLHMGIFSLFGFIVALAVRNHGDQSSISTFLITPMIFLSGVFFPVEKAPLLLQYIVSVFPLYHSVSLMRGTLCGTGVVWLQLGILVAFFAASLALAIRLADTTEG